MPASKLNILALETSSSVLSVALKSRKTEVLEESLDGFLHHAENLLPLIDRLLKKAKLGIDQIDAFLIGRGPGSFTGLRISFATLKGFLSVKKKPCYGALSLDMIAARIPAGNSAHLCVCLDARREKVYAKFYEQTSAGWKSAGPAKILSVPELTDEMPSRVLITGDALARYENQIAENAQHKEIVFMERSHWYPKASVLIDWFEELKTKPPLEKLSKPKDFVPFYFRLPEPVEKRMHAASH